jgi:hypothetical protein
MLKSEKENQSALKKGIKGKRADLLSYQYFPKSSRAIIVFSISLVPS